MDDTARRMRRMACCLLREPTRQSDPALRRNGRSPSWLCGLSADVAEVDLVRGGNRQFQDRQIFLCNFLWLPVQHEIPVVDRDAVPQTGFRRVHALPFPQQDLDPIRGRNSRKVETDFITAVRRLRLAGQIPVETDNLDFHGGFCGRAVVRISHKSLCAGALVVPRENRGTQRADSSDRSSLSLIVMTRAHLLPVFRLQRGWNSESGERTSWPDGHGAQGPDERLVNCRLAPEVNSPAGAFEARVHSAQ